MKRIKRIVKKKPHVAAQKEFNAVSYFQTNQKLLIAVLLVVFVVIICWAGYYIVLRNQNINANISISQYDKRIEYGKIIEKYPLAKLKPVMILELAANFYWEDKYQESLEIYQNFINLYPKHQLISSAETGVGYCYQQLGQEDKAINQFKKVCQNYPDSPWAKETAVLIK